MKSLVKIALISLPLLMAAPTFAQVSWGIGLQFGTPPPEREVIVERPYADGIWVPGYYNREAWVPGLWRHPHGWVAPERRYGYGYERGREFAGRERGGDRGREEFRRDGGRRDNRRDGGGRESRGNGGHGDNRQWGRSR